MIVAIGHIKLIQLALVGAVKSIATGVMEAVVVLSAQAKQADGGIECIVNHPVFAPGVVILMARGPIAVAAHAHHILKAPEVL